MPKTSEKAAAKPVAVKAKAPAKGDHVFLVDGSGYIFRAYHALPPLNRKSDGLQVNAVLGFCNMLWKLLRDMPPDNRPTHLAIVFDKSEVTFRNKLYPDYKAHRAPAPDDLIPQFALIREAVRAFDLPCLEQGGFEADDLIATYAREAGERGATATIVSSDKDLMQLVTDKRGDVRHHEGPPHRHCRGDREIRRAAGEGGRGAGAGRRFHRQRAGRARHRHQDRRPADRRIWRSRNAAGARRRDQAAEAARGADRECREGADFAAAGAARRQGQARRAARRTRGARARCAQADRVPEGDGIFHPDPPRRRIFADRPVGRGSRRQEQQRRQRQVGRLVASAARGRRRSFRTSGRARPVCFRKRQGQRARRRQEVRASRNNPTSSSRPRRSPPRAPRRRGRRRSTAAST